MKKTGNTGQVLHSRSALILLMKQLPSTVKLRQYSRVITFGDMIPLARYNVTGQVDPVSRIMSSSLSSPQCQQHRQPYTSTNAVPNLAKVSTREY